MTLSQIMTLALRQLDEDAQDLCEYESAFKVYANIGYDIAVREYLKPKAWREMTSDALGLAALDDTRILRVCQVRDAQNGRELPFRLTMDGEKIAVPKANAAICALCEVVYGDMTEGTDEPQLPAHVHHALADYICYRHLSSGSMAKQAKAQFFLQSFQRAMDTIRPQSMGSVTGYRHLYEATGVRGRR